MPFQANSRRGCGGPAERDPVPGEPEPGRDPRAGVSGRGGPQTPNPKPSEGDPS